MEPINNLRNLFGASQIVFQANLNVCRSTFSHPVLKGNGAEIIWKNFLIKYLPSQYGIDTGKVIDSSGKESDQIDIIIFDKFMPPLFNGNGIRYFPIEGVLAVFEVKPDIQSNNIKYASCKVASVQSLIPSFVDTNGNNVGSIVLPKIIGGLLATNKSRVKTKTINDAILYCFKNKHFIDVICCDNCYVRVENYANDDEPNVMKYDKYTLFAFLFQLLQSLDNLQRLRVQYKMNTEAYLVSIGANIYPSNSNIPLF